MNEIPETTKSCAVDTVCARLRRFANMKVGADYDLTLSLSDEAADKSSECSHHMTGSSKHSLAGLLAVGGLIVGALAATVCFVHVFCSLVCRSR